MSDQLQLRVTSVSWKSANVRAVELRSADGRLLPAIKAGSHIDITLREGLVRSYSLTNSEDERDRYLIGVARDRASRGGSVFIHDRLRVGDIVECSSPINHFALNEDAQTSILIGGGIGVTPMVSMAARLTDLKREWILYYAVRSRSEAAFLADLPDYGARVVLHCDDEEAGVLDLDSIISRAGSDAHFYCCGPAPMMARFEELTSAIDRKRVHVEYFSAAQEAATQGGLVVELARLGRQLAIPEGQTILEALLDAGIDVPNSCREGVCGTCETTVLGGVPDHRDSVLSAEERASNKTMMVCCSGALTEKLILDI